MADLLHVEPEHDAGAMAPAGQLWSTVEDLARWAAFLAGDTAGLLEPATLEEMCLPLVVNDTPEQAWTGAHGLGWQVWNVDGARFAGHGGSMPGFLAGLRVNLATGDGCRRSSRTRPRAWVRSVSTCWSCSPRSLAQVKPWHADAEQSAALELVGDWYWGTTGYDLRLAPDGHLLLGEPGKLRGTRLRPTETGLGGARRLLRG